MGIYDEIHDIRYLHDENAPRDHEPKKLPDLSNILKYKRLGSVLGLFIVLVGTGILIFNINQPQDTRSRASSENSDEEVIVRGAVTCTQKDDNTCDLKIVTDEGDEIDIDETTESGEKAEINEGEYVVVSGKITANPEIPTAKKITIKNLQSLGSVKQPTPTQSKQVRSNDPSPTVNDTPLPTPTPTPQVLKNNTPEPGVSYVTATYVIENKNTLQGKNVSVQSFLVDGYIGKPGCDFEPNCDVSHFILNDNNNPERNTNFDLEIIGGTTDKEGDYSPGQQFYTTGKVILSEDVLYLEKIN